VGSLSSQRHGQRCASRRSRRRVLVRALASARATRGADCSACASASSAASCGSRRAGARARALARTCASFSSSSGPAPVDALPPPAPPPPATAATPAQQRRRRRRRQPDPSLAAGRAKHAPRRVGRGGCGLRSQRAAQAPEQRAGAGACSGWWRRPPRRRRRRRWPSQRPLVVREPAWARSSYGGSSGASCSSPAACRAAARAPGPAQAPHLWVRERGGGVASRRRMVVAVGSAVSPPRFFLFVGTAWAPTCALKARTNPILTILACLHCPLLFKKDTQPAPRSARADRENQTSRSLPTTIMIAARSPATMLARGNAARPALVPTRLAGRRATGAKLAAIMPGEKGLLFAISRAAASRVWPSRRCCRTAAAAAAPSRPLFDPLSHDRHPLLLRPKPAPCDSALALTSPLLSPPTKKPRKSPRRRHWRRPSRPRSARPPSRSRPSTCLRR
jgi:hypothetical protein